MYKRKYKQKMRSKKMKTETLETEEQKLPEIEELKSFKDKLKEKGVDLKISLSNVMATPGTTANFTKKEIPVPGSAFSILSVLITIHSQ